MKLALTARHSAIRVLCARETERATPDDGTGHHMAGLREFLNGPAGKGAAIGLVAVGLGVAFFVLKGSFGSDELHDFAATRTFVDPESGKSFERVMSAGDTVPVESPFTGKKTGLPAERCYWTADGKIKDKPNGVLLNMAVGKQGATFCPECGRLVVPWNPKPNPGDPPPPTKDEYEKNRKNRDGD
jgi:hypothetical protein